MKILVVHNDYGKYSGEEAVVDRMIGDMRQSGHIVETLRTTSEGVRDTLWGKTKGFFAGIYSIRGRRLMRKALVRHKPDIVHIHNLYPFLSPAILPICKEFGVTVIMTVHNYRLICPTGLFLRDGKPCEQCLRCGNEWSCIRYNCEQSLFRSVGYAMRNMVARRRRFYTGNVDYFCCLTEFQKAKLIAAGFSDKKIKVIPNYIGEIEQVEIPVTDKGSYIGYVGRLSHEKGFDMLLEVARRHPEMVFKFAGTLRNDMPPMDIPANVTLCGQLDARQLSVFYSNARFIVIPSRCYEGFPMALLEASSHRRCCIAPNHGAFPDLMTDAESGAATGLLFKPLDIDDLEQKVMRLWDNCNESERLGMMAERNYKHRFTKETVIGEWNRFLNHVAGNNKVRDSK